MIVKSFPLIRPGVICANYQMVKIDKVLVRPDLLSICAADKRYFFGLRSQSVINKKLPMVLIHEALGTVMLDCEKNIPCGTKVVMLPCGINSQVNSNYCENAFFRSSNADGFCQEMLNLDCREIVVIPRKLNCDVFVLSELMSVCFQALRRIKKYLFSKVKIGIWGDGALSFLMSLLIRSYYPDSFIAVIGKHENKLDLFPVIDVGETIYARNLSKFDVCIECVGGNGAEQAIDDIINTIKPLGTILLTGVSETPPRINTRKILEKGLLILGTTRSVREDFINAINFINLLDCKIISPMFDSIFNASNENDICNAFVNSKTGIFKTMIKLSI